MTVQVKGMQELIDYFDKIGDKKTPKKALRKASEHVLKVEKEVAQQKHNKYSRNNADSGRNHLKKFPPRIRKNQGFVDVGLKEKGSTEWENIKGLYFNHYGFYHNGWHKQGTRKNRLKKGKPIGKYIAGTRWMDVAYDKAEKKAFELLEEGLMEGLDD